MFPSHDRNGLALARALIGQGQTSPQLVLDMGAMSTDLVISASCGPRLTRSIPTGSEAVIKAAMQNLNIDEKQAEQFVNKFGLSKDKLEGQVSKSISGVIDILVGELEKSIKFYNTRYPNDPIDRIIVTGAASTLPEFPLYIANKFGINIEIGNAWRNVSFPSDKQNDLMTISNHFGVAVGLAERIQ